MPAAATASGLPARLGKYELLSPLAAGGMARIYIGRSTGIGAFERHVVLKLITPERANDEIAVQMFLDEARLAAALNHQNVAQVFEVGEDAGIHYLAMEYVHGQDLRALLAKAGTTGTRIPIELGLTVVAGAAAGLNHAHERRSPDGTPLGIVHRDVSPSNIMIGYEGSLKLLDFGIAKATMRSVETQNGIIKGKFAYMAPEQCRGRPVDRRSDVFSLGIILYEVTTQHRCFRADSDFDTMHRIVTGDVVRPTRIVQGYPQALEAIVMKALAVDATQRYQSAGLLLEAIEGFAASAHMSLSTMALGRFMRETFGDVPEPWLVNASRSTPVPPKENTISQTNSQGGQAAAAPVAPVSASASAPDLSTGQPAHIVPVDSGRMEAAATVLELPRDVVGDSESEPESQREWNARSYPGVEPAVAPAAQPPRSSFPPVAGMSQPDTRPSHQTLRVAHTTPRNAPQRTQPPVTSQPPAPLSQPPAGSQQLPPANAFATPGSASRSRPSLPPYTTSPIERLELGQARQPSSDGADITVRPSRRGWLFVGGAVVVAGIVVVAVTFGGGSPDHAVTASGSEVAGASRATSEPTALPAPEAIATPDPPMITIHVDSTPAGADVLIAGTKIGTTPFEKKVRRGKTVAPLMLRHAGYQDYAAKIDFSDDFTAELQLKPTADANHGGSAAPAGSATPVDNAPASTGSATAPPVGSAAPNVDTPIEHPPAHKSETGSSKASTPEHHGQSDSHTKTSAPPTPQAKSPRCQLPGPNMDPYSTLPACKPGEKP